MRRSLVLAALLLMSFRTRADAWSDALARAQREQKPIVVFYRTADCPKCDAFERTASGRRRSRA